MKTINSPSQSKWTVIAQRPMIKQAKLMDVVEKIFYDINRKGDSAVLKYSRKYDFTEQNSLIVSNEDIEKAEGDVSERLKQAIDLARKNIETFHLSQKETGEKIKISDGITCWREDRPIEKIGIYVPGGSAPLFSTVLMLAIPAKIAGCKEIILCTPPNDQGVINPAILYTANLVGVTSCHFVHGKSCWSYKNYCCRWYSSNWCNDFWHC